MERPSFHIIRKFLIVLNHHTRMLSTVAMTLWSFTMVIYSCMLERDSLSLLLHQLKILSYFSGIMDTTTAIIMEGTMEGTATAVIMEGTVTAIIMEGTMEGTVT